MMSDPRDTDLDDDINGVEPDSDLVGGDDKPEDIGIESDEDLDDALEDTFPASDPISPP